LILQKLSALAKVNAEIIARIKSHKTVILRYQYQIIWRPNQKQFTVVQKAVQKDAQTIINEWKSFQKFEEIPDTFNDKLLYNATTFHEVIKLNEEMLPVAQKYKLFGGSSESLEVLSQFLKNYEVVQVNVGNLEEKMMGVKVDPAVKEKIDSINAEILELKSYPNLIITSENDCLLSMSDDMDPLQ